VGIEAPPRAIGDLSMVVEDAGIAQGGIQGSINQENSANSQNSAFCSSE